MSNPKVEDGEEPVRKNRSKFFGKYSDSEYSDSNLSPLSYSPSLLIKLQDPKLTDAERNGKIRELRSHIHEDEEALKRRNQEDINSQFEEVEHFIMEMKKSADEEEDDGLKDASATDKEDAKRLHKLERTRPQWLTCSLKILFHVMVIMNFFTSWLNSASLIIEEAKINMWLLMGDFNCLEIVPDSNLFDHTVNIIHALLSCSVLFVQNRSSATLCLALIFTLGMHTVYKISGYFCNLKFEFHEFINPSEIAGLVWVILFNAFGSLILLHMYYDLTDCYQTRSEKIKGSGVGARCLNNRIIFKNETYFMQRKMIIRDATVSQVYQMIKRMAKVGDSKAARIDPLSFYREITAAKMALQDCEKVENHQVPLVLKEAFKIRLKELEDEQRVTIGQLGYAIGQELEAVQRALMLEPLS